MSIPFIRSTTAGFALFLILAVLSPAPVVGQGTDYGSVYSRFGLGERSLPFSPIAQAMGGGGFGLGGTSYANLANPAALSDLSLTRALAGFRLDMVESTDASGAISQQTAGSLSGFSFGVPLIEGRFGVAIAMTPYTRTGYRVQLDRTFVPGEGIHLSDKYTAFFEGNGGLDRISLGTGYRVHPNLSLGVRGDFTFGILEDVQRVQFVDPAYEEVRIARATRLRGFSAGFGAKAGTASVIRDGDYLSLGAFVDTPLHLTAERVVTVGDSFEPDTLGASISGSMDLPFSFGVGIAYQSGVHLAVVADALYEPWSRFESDLAISGMEPGGESGMKDRSRMSAGLEFYPAGRDLLAGLIKRTAYRIGAFVEKSYVTPDPDRIIRSYGLTAGLSLPTLFPGTRVDINVEAGNRGTSDDALVQDRYLRLGVNVNFADRWFVRRPLN